MAQLKQSINNQPTDQTVTQSSPALHFCFFVSFDFIHSFIHSLTHSGYEKVVWPTLQMQQQQQQLQLAAPSIPPALFCNAANEYTPSPDSDVETGEDQQEDVVSLYLNSEYQLYSQPLASSQQQPPPPPPPPDVQAHEQHNNSPTRSSLAFGWLDSTANLLITDDLLLNFFDHNAIQQ